MKKYILIILLYTLGASANQTLLKSIEKNANYSEPIETTSFLFEKENFAKYLVQKQIKIKAILKTINSFQKIDMSKIKERRVCVYLKNNKKVKIYFNEINHQWKFLKSSNKLDKEYYQYNQNRCYKPSLFSSLKLIDYYSEVYNILGDQNKNIMNILVRLKKVYASKESYVHGWLVDSMHISKNVKYKKIKNKSIPKKYRTFFHKRVKNKLLSSIEQGKNGGVIFHKAPKVKTIQCRKLKEGIRVTFTLDKQYSINSFLERIENEYQRSYFGVNAKNVKVINCSNFLNIENKRGLTLDLSRLRKHISNVSYRKSLKSTLSQIDYRFQEKITFNQKNYQLNPLSQQ